MEYNFEVAQVVEENILYLDVLFLVNFTMDFVLIWATAKFTGFNTSFKKALLAASIGALYSITIYFPALHTSFSSLLIKIIFSIVMIYIAFYPLSLRKMMQALAYFYFIVFAAGGAMLAAVYLFKTEQTIQAILTGRFSILEPLRYNWLFAAIIAAIVVGRYGTRFIRQNFLKNNSYVPVIICIGDEKIALNTLVDTGNQLYDPISSKPVMIAELEALKSIIPEITYKELKKNNEFDINSTITCLSETNLASRLHVIPFNSIGEQKGMLLGIRPDSIIIEHDHKTIMIREIIVGIYNFRLSSKGKYNGLLHPELMQNAPDS